VWHFSSHSLTKWCNTPPYMLVYISPNFPYGTKLSFPPIAFMQPTTWAAYHMGSLVLVRGE
jgi:hypothetical protein